MCFEGRLRAVLAVAVAGLVFLADPRSVGAQTTSASVYGSVQDAQGGVLPGVAVNLTSRTQGNTVSTTTDDQGRFVFSIVRPDTYTLSVSLQGFKTQERTNLVVGANDRLSAGILTMEVGQMTEEVTVTSRVTELQSTTGERSFTLDSEALKNIASGERSFMTFTTLVPGIVQQGIGGQAPTAVSGFTVNGQRPNSNNMTIDGVANIDTGDNGGNMATLNIDAISEFKVLTNSYQAEYGRAVGGQVQVVTKSGTQNFHGSGYWYGRRSDWNANTWINNRSNTPKPKASRDDRGYTIGGPVYVPGTFNADKRRLFFFWSQEFQSRNDPVAERLARVPTALERAGDFSQTVDSSGNPFPYIKDYTTGLPCSAADTRGCFADNGVLGKIPANRIYQPGLNALKIYPQPNTSRGSGLNYASQRPTKNPRREDMVRMDFQATNSWRVTGRFNNKKDNQEQPYGTTWAGAGSDQLDTLDTLFETPGSNWMISTVGILNNSTSLEVSLGRAHNSLDFTILNTNLTRTAAGLTAFPLLFPDAVQADYIPDFIFNNNSGRIGNNAGRLQTDRGPFTNFNTTYDVVANLSKIWGPHAAKFGFYFQSSLKPQSLFASFNSQINFVDNASNPFDTQHPYANAVTGVFNTYTQANKFAIPEWRYKNVEWYLQDNWKASSRLTLDYGVRFYLMTPQWDTTLQASNFLPEAFNAGSAARLYRPVCIGASPCSGTNRRAMDPALIAQGVTPTTANTLEDRFVGRLTPGSNRFNGAFQAGQGIEEQLQGGNAFRTSPRLGVTYDLSGRGETIVRGGYAILYDRPQGNMVFDMITNAPGVLVSTLQWGLLQNLTASAGDPAAVLSLNPTAHDFKPPRARQWNVGVQHKLLRNFIADVAYVGSKSDDLLRQVQINALPFGATLAPQNQDPTRAPAAQLGSSALINDLLRPYPGYGNIRMWDYSGYTNYHALQTSLTRRFDRGWSFSAFYVWSKALGINSTDFSAGVPNLTDEETRRLDYSYLDYDRPHNFVVNFIYQIPKLASGPLGVAVNDWQVSGIYRWVSGRPYTVNFNIPNIGAANLTGTDGNPNARVVLTCDPGRGWSADPYRQLDTSCFAPPQPFSDGAESARFFVRAPPINNLDLSLAKKVGILKGIMFEVRADMFNALNHTQFTGVNATVNFASLSDRTITNLPYNSSGAITNQNGFGSINGVAPPRSFQIVTRMTF
jgi:hypothetical protein